MHWSTGRRPDVRGRLVRGSAFWLSVRATTFSVWRNMLVELPLSRFRPGAARAGRTRHGRPPDRVSTDVRVPDSVRADVETVECCGATKRRADAVVQRRRHIPRHTQHRAVLRSAAPRVPSGSSTQRMRLTCGRRAAGGSCCGTLHGRDTTVVRSGSCPSPPRTSSGAGLAGESTTSSRTSRTWLIQRPARQRQYDPAYGFPRPFRQLTRHDGRVLRASSRAGADKRQRPRCASYLTPLQSTLSVRQALLDDTQGTNGGAQQQAIRRNASIWA
jgi:hypothetical protein